ncbi:MAG: phosphomethylpyrimidine synthase ThiC [Actinobacteria bacterium]|nr:phosphomethylpyrimidine synthase ThiC [Actinomycetota bacterium]
MAFFDDLQNGRLDETLATLARNESVDVNELVEGIRRGHIAVLASRARRNHIRPSAVGEGLRVKVNANIGTSEAASSIEQELAKLDAALSAGTDAVMDLSTGGDLREVRFRILERCDVPLGTVPVYEAAVNSMRRDAGVTGMSANEMLAAVRTHAEDGVDFMTVHAGLTREQAAAASSRAAGIVSRGGAFLACWMEANDAENPYYERFDEVLDICRRHDVVLSLGDSLRPGCIADAGDEAQLGELRILGDLVLRARAAGVQVIVEGPGHVPISEIVEQMRIAKELCHRAPLYVLGPIVTDVAPGYDHVTSAIGGALAASAGADFLCYVTRAEHVCLPDADDVHEGVVCARIAAHAGDIARNLPAAREWDAQMTSARKNLDWKRQFAIAIDRQRPETMRQMRGGGSDKQCSMCGSLCAMRLVNELEASA